MWAFLPLVATAGLMGCAAQSLSDIGGWYEARGGQPPQASRVYFCHAFSCARTTPVTFSEAEMAAITAPLAPAAPDPAAEREAIAKSLQAFETIVGARLGTPVLLQADDVVRGGAGIDSLFGDGGDDALYGESDDDELFGGTGDDTLEGGAGDDWLEDTEGRNVLEGGTGADSFVGGADATTFIVDLEDEIVDFGAGEGLVELEVARENLRAARGERFGVAGVGLTVAGSASPGLFLHGDLQTLDREDVVFRLAGNVELTLAELLDETLLDDLALSGTSGDDVLRGYGGDDTIEGLEGNDRLKGGPGSNFLRGGAGDDSYVVVASSDTVAELPGEGRDTVEAAIDYALPSEVEVLRLSGTGPIEATGNSGDNAIFGNDGDNRINGLQGSDELAGGPGNDTYVFNRGDGEDLINDTEGRNVIDLGPGINPTDRPYPLYAVAHVRDHRGDCHERAGEGPVTVFEKLRHCVDPRSKETRLSHSRAGRVLMPIRAAFSRSTVMSSSG
jgi:hypothetical protein